MTPKTSQTTMDEETVNVCPPTKNEKQSHSLFFYIAWLSVTDLVAILVSFFIPWYFRVGMYDLEVQNNYLVALALYLITYFFLAFSENLYREDNFWSARNALFQSFKIMCLSYGVLLLLAFVAKETGNFSRIWGGTWIILLSGYLLASRLYTSQLIRHLARQGVTEARVMLVGSHQYIKSAYSTLSTGQLHSSQIVGYLADSGPSSDITAPYLGRISDMDQTINAKRIDDVVICETWSKREELDKLAAVASRKSVNIYLSPERVPPLGIQFNRRTIGSLSLIEIDRKPIDKWQALLKRAEDIAIAFLALLFLWPIMLGTAIAIKLESKGPIFFMQPRYGFNNELINVFKFRSMYTDMSDMHAAKQTTKDDPRITKVGRIIRKTSIDELPQLLNVLMGNMSLVGPRPHAKSTKAAGRLFEDVVDNYAVRHRVKPGVTGWAQVNGWRGETDTEEKVQKRVECDLYYIRNWSLLLDLYILFRTAWVVIFNKEDVY